MKSTNDNTGNLDRALSGIRGAEPDSGHAEQAAARVFQNLTAEYNKVVTHPSAADAQNVDRIRSCEDVRVLMPALLSMSLTSSRKLLIEDHIGECVACRRILEAASRGPFAGHSRLENARPRKKTRPVHYAIGGSVAAAILIVVALQTSIVRDFIWPIDVHAMAQTVNGGLYLIDGETVRALSAGQRVERYQAVRTGNDSGAVLALADGSRVEMSARSELSLNRMRDGVAINLHRGNVIVNAAKQGTGHLYVSTKDCTVSVVGTVFSVSAAAKGSRVSVIEGEVRVEQGGASQALRPGQQISTNPIMGAVAISQDIAWSRDAESHVALLKELVTFSQDISQRIGAAEMRYTSSLVPLVPENTVVFASLPNISQSFAQSYAMFKQRVMENALLEDWWRQYMGPRPSGLSVDEMVERVVHAGAHLGPEIILALPKDLNGHAPLLMANVTFPEGLIAGIQNDMTRLASVAGGESGVRLARSQAELQTIAALSGTKLVIYVDRGLMVASADVHQVQRTVSFVNQPASNPFSNTPLYARLAQAYTGGVGWLLAADLERLVNRTGVESAQLGLADIEQLVVEQKTGIAGPAYRATLGFGQTRRGMAAWLAEPSPMGALEFVSPNAYGVAAIVTRDPTLILDDLFAFFQGNTQVLRDIENYQREHGVDIRYDIAAPLGNEFLIAVDGPILPSPSWKVVIEVNDAARLQNAIQWSVIDFNREAAARQAQPLVLTSETSGGRTFYAMSSARFPAGIHYTFWAGYMIAAPSRALLMEAIRNHDTGNTLARSPGFQAQLPDDGRDFASGLVYQNIQGVTNALPVDLLDGSRLSGLPTIVSLFGEADRIVMSSKGVLGMNIASVAGIGGMIRAAGLK